MPSSRKLATNRANAQHSTGPRSREGKARSRVNALKHGLAVSASTIPALAPEIMHLAQLIAGENERDPVVWEAARQVASAAIDVVRARRARTERLGQMSQGAYFLPVPPLEPMPTQFLSYKSSSLDTRIRAVLDGTIDELHRRESAQIDRVFKAYEETQRIIQHNAQVRRSLSEWDQLERLDRYERRALSRRDKAIRRLDEARAVVRSKSHL
jgi:hypothetical protein